MYMHLCIYVYVWMMCIYVCVYIETESLCCTPEINTALQTNCPSI